MTKSKSSAWKESSSAQRREISSQHASWLIVIKRQSQPTAFASTDSGGVSLSFRKGMLVVLRTIYYVVCLFTPKPLPTFGVTSVPQGKVVGASHQIVCRLPCRRDLARACGTTESGAPLPTPWAGSACSAALCHFVPQGEVVGASRQIVCRLPCPSAVGPLANLPGRTNVAPGRRCRAQTTRAADPPAELAALMAEEKKEFRNSP